MNYYQASQIRKDFEAQYLKNKPWSDCVSQCNLLTRWSNPPVWSIYVTLKKPLPKEVEIPASFKTLPVRIELVRRN